LPCLIRLLLERAVYCAIDYETYYDDDYSVRTLGPRCYVLDPRFEAPIVSIVAEGVADYVGPPEEFDWEEIKDHEWVSWNTGFDRSVHRRLIELGKADVMPEVWHDASHLSVFLCAGRALATATRNIYGNDLDKGVRDNMKGIHYSSLDDDQKQAWLDYAMLDSKICYKIWIEYQGLWPEAEKNISLHTLKMCERGVHIDYVRAGKYQKALIAGLKRVEKRIPWAGQVNKKGKPLPITSPKQIAVHCELAGIPKPKTTNAKDPKFELWFETYGEEADFVKAVQLWRKYNKLLKTVETILIRCEGAGDIRRMEYGLFYFGAHTGRWSGAGGLNMQNLHRDPVKVGRTSVNIRSLIVPKPGSKFAIVDYSQIECRVIHSLAGDLEFLGRCKIKSPYQAHAETTMGWKGTNLKKDDKELYALAKARCLGLGFGCGPAKFVDVAKILAGITITFEDAQDVVKDYRLNNSRIVDLWGSLNDDFRRSLHRDYSIELPSGRVLNYFAVVREPGQRFGWDYRASTTMNGIPYKFYGGKLTENLVQATARDCLRDAVLRIEEKLPVVMHVHDEVIVEVNGEKDLEIIKKIMKETPDWIPGLPLSCDGILTTRYQK